MNKEEKLFWNYLRMCNDQIMCNDCPVGKMKGDINCIKWIIENFDKAIEIFKRWADEHQEETLLSDFLGKYPNTPLLDSGEPENICPHYLGYNDRLTLEGSCEGGCKKCWNIPLNEVSLCAQD